MTRTRAANAAALPKQTIFAPRRRFIGALCALPVIGSFSAAFFARKADAAGEALVRQISDSERKCAETREALDLACEAYEAALPAPHPSIDFTGRYGQVTIAAVERRLFDGTVVNRAVIKGYPTTRWVASPELIAPILRDLLPGSRRLRKELRRLMFRAVLREREIVELERSLQLEDLARAKSLAEMRIEELAKAVFAQPATTMAAALIQARMISAYSEAISDRHGPYQAGKYGQQLAASLQKIGAAA